MSSQTLSTNLRQIAAQTADQMRVFTNLAHRIDLDLLRDAFRITRKYGAPGVDGVTGRDYGKNLEENLRDLYERLRTGRYRATRVRRSWLPKDDRGRRPIGLPIFEDKLVQRAVVTLLSPIYELRSRSKAAHPATRSHRILKVRAPNFYPNPQTEVAC